MLKSHHNEKIKLENIDALHSFFEGKAENKEGENNQTTANKKSKTRESTKYRLHPEHVASFPSFFKFFHFIPSQLDLFFLW